jgi:predicted transcriptional regulator
MVKSIKIDDDVLERLQNYLSKMYSGQMYGEIKRATNEAITEWVDRRES